MATDPDKNTKIMLQFPILLSDSLNKQVFTVTYVLINM